MKTMDHTWLGRGVVLFVAALGACGGVSPAGPGNDGATDSMAVGGRGGGTGAAGTSGVAGAAGTSGVAGASGTGGGAAGRGGASGTTGVAGAAGRGGAGGATGVSGAGGGAAGRGGAGGGAGAAGRGGSAGGAAGAGGSRSCAAIDCVAGRDCCNGACVNTANDPFNCGGCNKRCEGDTPFCSEGKCTQPTCSTVIDCQVGATCCGNTCCGAGQLCCDDQGPVGGRPPTCHTPTKDEPTCPQGCAPLCISDRNKKKNITPADTDAVLDKVSKLPISTWSYTAEPADVRHMGPMAQDFRASFGLGDDDRTYNAIDAHGVALAAIQALEKRVVEQGKRIERLERENRRLRSAPMTRQR